MLTSKPSVNCRAEEHEQQKFSSQRFLHSCAYLVLKTRSRNMNCVSCKAEQCDRMTAIGLDTSGAPLPSSARPRCGAKLRKGGLCSKPVVPAKKRCRLHGGLSTGPKTAEGKKRIREAQKRRWGRAEGVPVRNQPLGLDPAAHQPRSTEQHFDQPSQRKVRPWRRRRRISPWAL